jgi:ferrochelatase
MVTSASHQDPVFETQSAPTNEGVAVLLTSYGGVQNYRNFIAYNQRASEYIAAKFAPIPAKLYPLVARVLALRDLYKWGVKHDHFTSPQNDIFEQQRSGIEQELQAHCGAPVKVLTAFYFCEPFVEQVVQQIREKGFRKLLIYPLLVVDSVFTSSIAVEQVNEAIARFPSEPHPGFTHMRYIPSFANRPEYADLMVRQVEAAIATDLAPHYPASQVGLVLAVHGGPQKSQGLVTGVEEGQQLFDRVQAALIHRWPLISIGWINHPTPFVKWSIPTLKQAANNLIDLGARVIVIKPIGWATDNYETILEPEEAMASLQRRHPHITFQRLGCADAHPEFVQMAADWAKPDVSALLSAQPVR